MLILLEFDPDSTKSSGYSPRPLSISGSNFCLIRLVIALICFSEASHLAFTSPAPWSPEFGNIFRGKLTTCLELPNSIITPGFPLSPGSSLWGIRTELLSPQLSPRSIRPRVEGEAEIISPLRSLAPDSKPLCAFSCLTIGNYRGFPWQTSNLGHSQWTAKSGLGLLWRAMHFTYLNT